MEVAKTKTKTELQGFLNQVEVNFLSQPPSEEWQHIFNPSIWD